MTTKTLKGLLGDMASTQANSPIGPLHGAGINDASRHWAAQLQPLYDALRELWEGMAHTVWECKGAKRHAPDCPKCRLAAVGGFEQK